MSSRAKGRRPRSVRRRVENVRSDPAPTKNPRRIKNKLFIGDLLPTVTREDLVREFNRYGKLQDVWLAHNPPGFAFVEFVYTKDAENVVQIFDGKPLLGSKIRVEFAKASAAAAAEAARQQKRSSSRRSEKPIVRKTNTRVSPLMSRDSRPSLMAPPGILAKSIPPLLPFFRANSPVQRKRGNSRHRDVPPLSRNLSPTPLMAHYRRSRSPVPHGRVSSPITVQEFLSNSMIASGLSSRDRSSYNLLPVPPSLRGKGRGRSPPVRMRSRSPLMPPMRMSPMAPRLLGRTPPSPSDRSSPDRRLSPRRSRGRGSPAGRYARSPGSPPLLPQRRSRSISPQYRRGQRIVDTRMKNPISRESSMSPRNSRSPVVRPYTPPPMKQDRGVRRYSPDLHRGSPPRVFSGSVRSSTSPQWPRNRSHSPPHSPASPIRLKPPRRASPRMQSPPDYASQKSYVRDNDKNVQRRAYISPASQRNARYSRSSSSQSPQTTRPMAARSPSPAAYRHKSPMNKRYASPVMVSRQARQVPRGGRSPLPPGIASQNRRSQNSVSPPVRTMYSRRSPGSRQSQSPVAQSPQIRRSSSSERNLPSQYRRKMCNSRSPEIRNSRISRSPQMRRNTSPSRSPDPRNARLVKRGNVIGRRTPIPPSRTPSPNRQLMIKRNRPSRSVSPVRRGSALVKRSPRYSASPNRSPQKLARSPSSPRRSPSQNRRTPLAYRRSPVTNKNRADSNRSSPSRRPSPTSKRYQFASNKNLANRRSVSPQNKPSGYRSPYLARDSPPSRRSPLNHGGLQKRGSPMRCASPPNRGSMFRASPNHRSSPPRYPSPSPRRKMPSPPYRPSPPARRGVPLPRPAMPRTRQSPITDKIPVQSRSSPMMRRSRSTSPAPNHVLQFLKRRAESPANSKYNNPVVKQRGERGDWNSTSLGGIAPLQQSSKSDAVTARHKHKSKKAKLDA